MGNMRLFATCTSALLGIVILSFFNTSECLQMTVRPDKGSTVTVSTGLPAEQCAVCTVRGVNNTETSCQPSLTLVSEEDVNLLFNCSQPIDQAYSIEISRSIECTEDSCRPTRGEAQSSFLTEFVRTFTWDLTAPKKTVLGVDVLGDGLKEMSEPMSCPDGYHYSVTRAKPRGGVQKQAYCRGGSVTHLDLPNQVTMSLQVKPNAALLDVVFTVTAKPLKGRMIAVTADPGTTVAISMVSDETECNVCTKGGSDPTCSPTELTLTNPQNTSLEFSCPQPQDVFSVQVKKNIECTKRLCSPAMGTVEPSLFSEFPRTLTWDLTIPERTVLSLDFPGSGLKEKTAAGNCVDGYLVSVSTTDGEREVSAQDYCRAGPVSHLDMLGKTTVTIDVPKGGELDSPAFTANAMPRKGRSMSVTPDPNTIVTVSRESKEPECSVCVGLEPAQTCHLKELVLRDASNTSVEFSCPRPQDVFHVQINREIDCTEIVCSGNIVQVESSFFPDFNRTFTWDLKVPSTRTFQLDFPTPGMRQVPNGDTCPDEHTYTIVTYQRSGIATIGTYCRGGTIGTVQVRYKGRVSLKVPGDRQMESVDFKVTVGPVTDVLAILKVDLPRGVSDTDFITANYPRDFPSDEQTRWDFVVPGMHNYTVRFLGLTEPECLDREVSVEYQKDDTKVTRLTLTDPQPEHKQGDFHMSLSNCRTNKTLAGLTLNFRVSVMRSGHPVLCTVDLKGEEDISVQIEKIGSDPYCEMRIDSAVQEKISVAPGTEASLSFLDCTNEDLRLTASKTIGCPSLDTCSVDGILLTMPKLASCLPMPLHSFTWHLNIPEHATVELLHPTGLHQSLPDEECNGTVSLHVAWEDGSSIGDFCPKGIVKKVQVHGNISVTAKARDFSKTRGAFLNVSFSEEISESIIYRVSPQASSPALLASPNWPHGMKPFSTVSWIISLTNKYRAELQFVNISQPKCGQRHTSIKVQTLGSDEEMLSRREDEEAEDKLLVPESFYLNMSNCEPEEGHFGAVAKVTLQQKSNLLAIILGIVGALLVLALVVLAVVCFVTKKKKKGKMNMESSIYIGKGNIFLPGNRQFPKARSDNESHVYASIDETMVYGHLLHDATYVDSVQENFNGMIDSYRTFMGPTEEQPPGTTEAEPEADKDPYRPFLDPAESFIPSRPRTPIDRQDSLGFEDRRMVDNELYTFKSTGDFNTIRLSGVDQEPQPGFDTVSEESL